MASTPTRPRAVNAVVASCLALAGCGGGGSGAAAGPAIAAASATLQEQQCMAAGWQRTVLTVAGVERVMLWKAPPVWTQGAIVVLHGGGGAASNFCVANVELIAPQPRLSEMALAQGFAMFLLDSSDRVTDTAGRLCGKVWDDEPRGRANLDLPFIEQVLGQELPLRRPAGSRSEQFLVGHSSGGYMAVRAASALGGLITAVAPVSSGDPYGWHRDCSPRASDRSNVFGVGLDNDSGLNISVPDACAGSDAAEREWTMSAGAVRPLTRLFHHQSDGINDASCVQRVRRQLTAHGFAPQAPFTLTGGPRSVDAHYWLDAYNGPLLSFFSARP